MTDRPNEQKPAFARHAPVYLSNVVLAFFDRDVRDVVEGRKPRQELERSIRLVHLIDLNGEDVRAFFARAALPVPGKSSCDLRYPFMSKSLLQRAGKFPEGIPAARIEAITALEERIRAASCETKTA